MMRSPRRSRDATSASCESNRLTSTFCFSDAPTIPCCVRCSSESHRNCSTTRSSSSIRRKRWRWPRVRSWRVWGSAAWVEPARYAASSPTTRASTKSEADFSAVRSERFNASIFDRVTLGPTSEAKTATVDSFRSAASPDVSKAPFGGAALLGRTLDCRARTNKGTARWVLRKALKRLKRIPSSRLAKVSAARYSAPSSASLHAPRKSSSSEID